MAYTLHLHQTSVFCGLGTYTYTTKVAGLFSASAVAIEVPTSGMLITINKNGSPVTASTPYTGAQEILSAYASMVCAIADVITIVVSSSTPTDPALNAVKITASVNLIAGS